MSPTQFQRLVLRCMGALAGMIALFLLVVPGALPGQSDFLRRSEERARQILHKTVDALGGEAYLKARTIVREGKFFQFRRDDLRGSSKFRTLEAPPLKRRVEVGQERVGSS